MIFSALNDKLYLELDMNDEHAMSIATRSNAMTAEGVDQTLASCEWLTIEDFTARAIVSTEVVKNWNLDRKIFSVVHEGVRLFPVYLLDQENKPNPVVTLLITMFHNHKTHWSKAFWFAGHNGFLGGKRPMDLLIEDRYKVIQAAAYEILDECNG